MGSGRRLLTLFGGGGAPYPARAPDTLFSFVPGYGEENIDAATATIGLWRDQSGNGNDATAVTSNNSIKLLPGNISAIAGTRTTGLALPSMSLASPYTFYLLWSKQIDIDINNYLFRSGDGSILIYRVATSDLVNGGFNGPQIAASDDTWYAVRVVSTGGSDSKISIHDGTTETSVVGTINLSFSSQIAHILGNTGASAYSSGYIGWIQMVANEPADQDNDPIYNAIIDRISNLPAYGDRVLIDNNSTSYCAFGNTVLDGTDLICVYRRGPSHFNMPTEPGDLYISTSADSGDTWSAPAQFYTDSVNSYDARDPRITVLSSGRWIVLFFLHDGTNVYPYVIYSDNDGGAWSAEIPVTTSFTSGTAACSGPIIQLANGDLLAALYSANGDVRFSRSDDNGATWADEGDLIEDPPGYEYSEPNLGITDDGNILCLIRCSDWNVYRAVGTYSAGSITWGSATAVCTGSGAPGWMQASDDTIYLMNRDKAWYDAHSGSLAMCVKKSTDRGVTWTASTFPYPSVYNWEYGNPIQLGNGDIYLSYFEEYPGQGSLAWWAELVE